MRKVFIIPALLFSLSLSAQSVTGRWKTIDDNTGRETAIIEIFERNAKIYGKIVEIFPDVSEKKDPVCEKCDPDDPRYLQKVLGMEILQGLTKDDEEYSDGTILDPKNGKLYDCKIWLSGPDLKVRGYWGVFYRTQTWKKVH